MVEEQPVYRKRESSDSADLDAIQYSSDDEVDPTTFGMVVREVRPRGRFTLAEKEEVEIPLTLAWGFQATVYEPHVRLLASVPGDRFVGENAPSAIAWYDGTYQVIGHHRLAAAYLRGDAAMHVRITMRMEPAQ